MHSSIIITGLLVCFSMLRPGTMPLLTGSSPLWPGPPDSKGKHFAITTVDELKQRIQRSPDTLYVVNFWATWCAPCLTELPHFERLARENNNRKIKVILVSMDYKSQLHTKLQPFLAKSTLKNEVVWLNENDSDAMINKIDSSWSGALPATLMIAGNNRHFYEKEFKKC
jgi:thiol-disulfide isomerase/thioredoxin